MITKDQLINDLFISSKSYNDFYKKELLNKYKALQLDVNAINQLNQQLIYNLTLMNKSIDGSLFQLLQVKKAKEPGRTYEEINLLCRLCPHFSIKVNNKEIAIENFLQQYNKLSEELICHIAKYPFEKLNNYGVVHKHFGFLTFMELIYVIISKSYCYIDLYKICTSSNKIAV